MKGDTPRICVVGSMVIDLAFRVERRPGPGETVWGTGFGMFLGGKGFNQAVACRRLGAAVELVGRAGDDEFGNRFAGRLAELGIESRFVARDPAGTGVACPVVEAGGENSIIAAPRANLKLSAGDVDAAADAIARADALLLQFEVPVEASARAAEIARRSSTLVFLDPAPVQPQGRGGAGREPRRLIDADYIVPNEVEAYQLTGRRIPEEQGAGLLPLARRAAVITLGARGAFRVDRQEARYADPFAVAAVDTTGAGDAFRGALALALVEGRGLDDALRFASAAGALACTVIGAEPSMPKRDAVERLLAGEAR